MKENFFTSMFMEGGKVSHKRVIAVIAAVTIVYMAVFATIKYTEGTVRYMFVALIGFVLVMSGVATVAQIASILKGTQDRTQEGAQVAAPPPPVPEESEEGKEKAE